MLALSTCRGSRRRAGRGGRTAVRGAGGSHPTCGRAAPRCGAEARRRARGRGRDVASGDEPPPARAAAARNRGRRAPGRRRPGAPVPAAPGGHRPAPGVARPAPRPLGRAAPIVQATRRTEDPTVTETKSVSSQVEVGVDADTAFAAFTEEMDLWWVRGPINYYDASRAVARRCEPGLGGRLLEVYDAETGDALELGRITAWEPGARLAWRSSTDDVEIEVRFDRSAGGTTVRVDARIPAGGEDSGGTSWVRVVPPWFGAWCAKRDTSSREPRDLALLALAVYYAKPATAARWLAAAFGFEATNPLPDDDDASSWIEFHVGNCSLMVFGMEGELPDSSSTTL